MLGKDYRIVFPFKYTHCYPKYNERGRLEYFTCIRLYFNGIDIREVISRILYDSNSHINNIEIVIRFCQDIIKYIKKFYTLPTPKLESPLKKTKSPKTVFALGKNDFQYYKNQLVDLLFNEKPIDFLSCIAEENLEKYKFEVYKLLNCIGVNEFHKLEKEYYFGDNGYLELLEYYLRNNIEFNRELKGVFINLRFDSDKLVLKFKRDINYNINCNGFAIDVIDNFIEFGMNELYEIFDYYNINRNVFENNTTAERYTRYHLAKKINCNVEIEQPELLDRLVDKVGKEKESLSKIGLEYHKHCIDYSKGHAEYEILADYPHGVSLDELKRDLRVLEPDIRPKQQSLDKFIDNNSNSYNPKFYMLLKKYLPISVFSIEPNKAYRKPLSLEPKTKHDINDLIIMEETFINKKFLPIDC